MNNKKKAAQVLWAGSVWAIIILFVVTRTGGPIVFDENTAHVGDTIGGILGPALNLTGLLVLYYSLREQFVATRDQRRGQQEEASYTIALRLVDETRSSWKDNRQNLERLLQEEDQLSLLDPDAFDYMEETDDTQERWFALQDLRATLSFFEAFQSNASPLPSEQRRAILGMFRAVYFMPLRRLTHANFEQLANEADEYRNVHGQPPHPSPLREEIARQLILFDNVQQATS
ncbi:hypothetical protein CLV45_2370 [Hymenobacter chitinivorans DSM 11115]|uniref:Phage abortive infection protein n=2 Tax=Hymenobacter chitinivorans TaxID=89969 RepID=A0A2M9BSM4_9BACT|nr:hypothetical protein CLV45_2370 [Hymenobacter chitinivorans DSM 11115]